MCVVLFSMQNLMGSSLHTPIYPTTIYSFPIFSVKMFSYLSMQIKSADNRILQEQLQNKVKITLSYYSSSTYLKLLLISLKFPHTAIFLFNIEASSFHKIEGYPFALASPSLLISVLLSLLPSVCRK